MCYMKRRPKSLGFAYVYTAVSLLKYINKKTELKAVCSGSYPTFRDKQKLFDLGRFGF